MMVMHNGWSKKVRDADLTIDAIPSATWHYSGSVLATCSGQRHFNSTPKIPSRTSDNSFKLWTF